MITMMASAPLSGGLIEDLEREDDDLGPEPDESEQQFLRVLLPYTPHAAGTGVVRLAPHGTSGNQCDTCGGWFGVTFWTCGACQAIPVHGQQAVMAGRPLLPVRPQPHERDGRGQPPAPVRPHPPAPH
ncbi:hypothetical protein ACWD4T_33960 [Streptomyces umbrinus]